MPAAPAPVTARFGPRPWSRLVGLALGLAVLVLALGCRRHEAPATRTSGDPIASRTVFADELLWEFGPEVRARVVALSTLADDPRYSTVAGKWPDTVPRLGTNPEQLLALSPKLVILASFNAPEYRAAIEDKLEVLILDDFDGFDGYLTNVGRVGEAIGEPKRAAQLQAAFSVRRAKLEAGRPPVDARPTVISWGYGSVAGADTTFDDAARTAGFVNLAAREGVDGHQRLDVEQLVAWNPDYLVVGCGEDGCAATVSGLTERPGVGKLAAVRERHVIAIEAPYLTTTGAGMLELSAQLQARLERQVEP